MKSLFNIIHRSLLAEAQSGKARSARGNDGCTAAAGRALLLTAVAAAATGEVLPIQRRTIGAGDGGGLDDFTILAFH